MSYTIRPLCRWELEAGAEVVRRSFATVADQFHLTRENCPASGAFMTPERLTADFESGVLLYGLFEEGEAGGAASSWPGPLVGFYQLRRRGEGQMELEKLAVLPQRRHRGYGRALLDHARHTAAKWDGIRLTAGIIEEDAQLKRWYLQNGFFYTGGRSFDHLPFSVGYVEAPVLPAHLRHRGTVELNTSRLILRQLRPDDYLDMFHNWASDPQVSRFLGWKTHTDLLETRTILTQWMPHYQEPQYYHWAMVYEGHPIGAISVHSIDGENKSCELGYCIGRDYWGRGLTAEAVKEVVGFLFTRVGLACRRPARSVEPRLRPGDGEGGHGPGGRPAPVQGLQGRPDGRYGRLQHSPAGLDGHAMN